MLVLEGLRRCKSLDDRATVGDERDVGTLALDVGQSKGYDVVAIRRVRDFAGVAIEKGIFHEVDGVVVTDCGLDQALGIGRCRWSADLQAGKCREEAFGNVRVGGTHAGAAIRGATDDDGTIAQAARHVTDTGGVADQLVEGYGMERPKHQFHHRTYAKHRCAYTHANKASLGNRRIDHPFVTPLFPKSFGYFVSAVVLGYFLAHQDDVWIAGEFLIEAFTEGFTVGKNARHGENFEVNAGGECSVVEKMAADLGGGRVVIGFPINISTNVCHRGCG